MSGKRQPFAMLEEREKKFRYKSDIRHTLAAQEERRSARAPKTKRWQMLAAEFHAKFPGLTVHHVFGRRGRELFCRLFMVPLPPGQHFGSGIGKLSRELRDEMRRNWLAYQKANAQNRDAGECWYKECAERDRCALTAELKDDDGGDE